MRQLVVESADRERKLPALRSAAYALAPHVRRAALVLLRVVDPNVNDSIAVMLDIAADAAVRPEARQP